MDDRSSARAVEKKDKLAGKWPPRPTSRIRTDDDEAQIKSADMTEEMQQQAIEVASDAMEKFTIEKDIAQYIKKEVREDDQIKADIGTPLEIRS
ncbi:MAG: hypothetical protein Q9219_002939 [cf. Caloplaca sp. 3 TL-2023]